MLCRKQEQNIMTENMRSNSTKTIPTICKPTIVKVALLGVNYGALAFLRSGRGILNLTLVVRFDGVKGSFLFLASRTLRTI